MTTVEAVLPLFRQFLTTLRSFVSEFPDGPRALAGEGWRATLVAKFHEAVDTTAAREYATAMEALNQDSGLRDRLGHMVGVGGMGLAFWSPENLLSSALERLLNEPAKVLNVGDVEAIAAIEQAISDRSEALGLIIYRAPLFGLNTSLSRLDLAGGISIAKMTDDDIARCTKAGLQAPIIAGGDFVSNRNWYAIQFEARNPIKVGDSESNILEDAEASEAANKTVDDVLLALRLLKAGDLGSPGVVAMSPQVVGTRTTFSHDTARIRHAGPYQLVADDAGPLDRLVKHLSHRAVLDNKPLQLALRRFTYALERQRPDDQLLDLVIAGEALFLPADNVRGESTFRFAIRAASLLEQAPSKRRRLFKFMKEAYGARAAIVHGSSKEPTFPRLNGKEGDVRALNEDLEDVIRRATVLNIEAAVAGSRKRDWEELLFPD